MMRDCLMADSRKGSCHQQKGTDVSESSHGSMCDVIAGLGAAPAGRVDQAAMTARISEIAPKMSSAVAVGGRSR